MPGKTLPDAIPKSDASEQRAFGGLTDALPIGAIVTANFEQQLLTHQTILVAVASLINLRNDPVPQTGTRLPRTP